MPASHPPIRPHPAKPFRTWRDAARDQQIAIIRCNGCHRSQNYLAEDLARVFGPDQPAHVAPFDCSRCKTKEFIGIRLKVPWAEESLTLKVRRPVKPIQRWIWRTVPLASS